MASLLTRTRLISLVSTTAISMLLGAGDSAAADLSMPGLSIDFADGQGGEGISTAIKVLLGLTVLSVAPALLIMMTSFIRIIVVLSILRHALSMQQTPPNAVLVGLAMFLTFFNMMPAFQSIQQNAMTPFLEDRIDSDAAFESAMSPLRDFMIRQTREEDLELMLEVSNSPMPDTVDDVSSASLIPAFMLSELKMAFQIGFVIFLPFVLIDIVVASILMSMGMLMVPPMMLSLPIKILMFVLIDGWNLVVRSLLGSFV
ncbi:flagellar type III secretion system pore protein FliP [Myxococcota bacterium]|nr:flagellar type III secretion system pore protein FliP [Myxococcota bacterium]